MSNTDPHIPDSLTNVKKFVSSDFTNYPELGHGREANVYKGFSGEYGIVAIKALFIKIKVEEMREVEVLIKHSRHPNIVQLYGVLLDGISSPLCAGYVMEYMPNGSLDDVIHKLETPYSWTEISSWIRQISRGIGYLHGEGVIHRDIKPSNLLLGITLEILKISDFGLATTVDVGSHTAMSGSFHYMAPEVIQTRNYSFSADIYSFAITVWELFCRKKPYYHLDQSLQFALLTNVVRGKRPLFQYSVDEAVVTFLKRAWAANPGERPEIRDFLTFADIPNVQVELNTTVQTSVPEVPLLIGFSYPPVLYILDVEANTWKRPSLSLPYKAWDNGSAFLNGEIYIFGGFPQEELRSAYKLTKEMKWTKLPDMSSGRNGICNSTVVFDECIWVIGGFYPDYLKSVAAYDPNSNSWIRKPDMNTERYLAAAAVVKEKIFVCGGRNREETLNSVEYFDTLLSKWIFCTPMPALRHGLAAVAQDGLLTVMGGRHTRGSTADVWRMNVDDSRPTWSVLPSMKTGRSRFTASIVNGRMMVAGGWKSPLSVELFDGKKWTKGPSLPSEADDMTTILIPKTLARTLLTTFPSA